MKPDNDAVEYVRMLVEYNRHDTGLDRTGVEPQEIRSVGIVGAGMMGTAIAAVHLRRNLPVTITDADQSALATAKHSLCNASGGCHVERLLHTTTNIAEVACCDLVIESIAENVTAKQQLYGQMQGHLGEGTILASNTSTIQIERLAGNLGNPGKFCGFHFCHPVQERPLVEVVRGPATTDRTIATAVTHAKAIEKMPIVVGDCPGFLVNRLLLPYLSEALEMLLEGVSIEAVERAATDFGMAIGPIRLLDEIGLDTVLNGGWILAAAFPDRVAASPLLVAMVKAGRLGCKSGAGFFSYDDGSDDPTTDETVDRLIEQWSKVPVKHTPEMIVNRMLLPMVAEASRILEEGKVRNARDIDLAVIFALGFPVHCGGLFFWADTLQVIQQRQLKDAGGGT